MCLRWQMVLASFVCCYYHSLRAVRGQPYQILQVIPHILLASLTPACAIPITCRCPAIARNNTLAACRGGLDDDAKSPGSLILLASSVSISWVFAKSIQNASTLGAQYGLVGCLAYGERAKASLSLDRCPVLCCSANLNKSNTFVLCLQLATTLPLHLLV